MTRSKLNEWQLGDGKMANLALKKEIVIVCNNISFLLDRIGGRGREGGRGCEKSADDGRMIM